MVQTELPIPTSELGLPLSATSNLSGQKRGLHLTFPPLPETTTAATQHLVTSAAQVMCRFASFSLSTPHYLHMIQAFSIS